MNRRRRRRIRITKAIRFYLQVYRYGQWTANTDIILHLEKSMRGNSSINSLSRESLGAYLRSFQDAERAERYVDGRRQTMYRILPREEE